MSDVPLISEFIIMTDSSSQQLAQRILRGGLVVMLAKIVIQIMQWAVTLVVARLLLPRDYGVMAIAAILTELAGILATAGFGNALVQRAEVTQKIIAQVFTMSLIFSLLLYAGLWLAIPTMAQYAGSPEHIFFFRVICLSVLCVPIYTVCNAILERDLRLTSLAKSAGVAGLLQSAVVVASALAGAGVWSLGIGALSGGLVRTGLTWWQSRWRPALAWPDADGFQLARYGFTIASTSMLWFAYSNADKALITLLLGPVSLGLYAFAFQFVTMPVDKIGSEVNKMAFVVYCRLQSERDRLREWYLRLVSALFALMAPALIGAALISDEGIPLLLGDKWQQLVLPFQILAPVGALMMIATTVPPLLNALGRPDIPFKYVAVCSTIYPFAFLIAAKLNGLIGICFAWLILYPVQTLALIHASRHLTGVSASAMIGRLGPFLKALVAMIIAVLLVRSGLSELRPSARIAACVACGALVYGAAVYIFVGREAISRTIRLVRELKTSNPSSPPGEKPQHMPPGSSTLARS